MKDRRLELKRQSDVIAARQACRQMARQLGFGSANQTRLATAVSEITRNAIQYAGKGMCVITDRSDAMTSILVVSVDDNGPGISDLDKALEPGFSTRGGLGMGLPGARRLVHEFSIKSQPGNTVVRMKLMRKKA